MLNVVMELGNAEAIEMAVEQGIGVAFISELAAARGLALGRIRTVEVEGMQLNRTIYMARNLGSPLTRAQDRFWHFVAERQGDLYNKIWSDHSHLALEFS
jgi:DNA-binding transcriptional LysR family regulator